MNRSVGRRELMRMGAGAAVTVAAASAAPGRAEALRATAIGRIAVERLWRYYTKYVRTIYYDTRGRRRARYTRTKVLRTRYVYSGTDKRTLNTGGLCHWIGTAQPLTNGNCVLFGHRTSSGGPLRYTHRMRVGDRMVLSIDGVGSKTYAVVEAPKVISSRDFVQAINWGDVSRSNVTMVACTKPNKLPTSTKFRLLIRMTEV